MRQAPHFVVEAAEQRRLTVIQVRVYADRIVSTELGRPYSVHGTPAKPPPRSKLGVRERELPYRETRSAR